MPNQNTSEAGQRLYRCGRPAATAPEDVTMCREHRDLWDADAEREQWRFAVAVLKPWVESTEAIGYDKLTQVMERALSEAEEGLECAEREVERAEAALEA